MVSQVEMSVMVFLTKFSFVAFRIKGLLYMWYQGSVQLLPDF